MLFNKDIAQLAQQNTLFRQELVTTQKSQIVLMSIPPHTDIGSEVHDVDQIVIIVSGRGETQINGHASFIGPNHMIIVPAGSNHNFINTGTHDLKLYTIYAPPAHKPGARATTKAEARANPE